MGYNLVFFKKIPGSKVASIWFFTYKIKSVNLKVYASKIKLFHNIKWDLHEIVFTEFIYLKTYLFKK
jgi:hypothetical protein